MLAVMHSRGSISAEMNLAGGQLATVILTGSRPVSMLLGSLGLPAGSSLIHVLGLGWSLKEWAQQGWRGQAIAQETASGILIAALAALVDGKPRLLLDEALAEFARGGAGTSGAHHRSKPAGRG
jgi:hypothetical protein